VGFKSPPCSAHRLAGRTAWELKQEHKLKEQQIKALRKAEPEHQRTPAVSEHLARLADEAALTYVFYLRKLLLDTANGKVPDGCFPVCK
jgi:hypothetical protein